MLVILLFGGFLALRVNAIHRQDRASDDLKKLGAQLQLTDTDNGSTTAWLLGRTSKVSAVHFLGPGVGDEHIDEIVNAGLDLRGLKRMTFAESRISRDGELELKSRLANVEIDVLTPILAPPISPMQR